METKRANLFGVIQFIRNVYRDIDKLFWRYPYIIELFRTKCFLAGGCFASYALDEPIKDYDFFALDKETLDYLVSFLKTFKETEMKAAFEVTFESSRAISFRPKCQVTREPYFQLITMDYGPPNDVINRFDWVHSMVYGTYFEDFYLHPQCKEVLDEKVLRLNPSYAYDMINLHRVRKFQKRGWELEDESERGMRLLREQTNSEAKHGHS